ncbi:MAG: LysM peptidoglycan-binding domain-containing protein [Solirubrobacterales bacterium]|nr:LysM peptidoglycan-binding domain-containing protein [Solirubrobacterales bacterium]
MPYRSPTRFLAPIALLGAVLAIYLVAKPQLGSSEESGGQTPSQSTPAAKTTTKKPAKKARKTYTVKSGDVLGEISAKTGVPIEDLLDFNDIDASQLSVGQKLKLTP